MIRSTFYGLTTAVSGLKASQSALDVIGQNVSNSNTEGYTRQRVVQTSVYSNTTAEKYGSATNNLAGQGTRINSLSQIRDNTLDTKFRVESASVGRYDAELSAMTSIEGIFDEAQTSGMRDAILALQAAFENQSLNAGLDEFDSLTRASASSMCSLLNQYAQQLKDAYDQEVYDFVEGSVNDANGILKNLAIVNQSILNSEVSGGNPLELYDQRNQLLDQLSAYAEIDYYYEKNQLAPDIITNTLHVSMKTQNGQLIELMDGVNFAQFGVEVDRGNLDDAAREGANPVTNSATQNRDNDITINDNTVKLLVSGLTDDTTMTYEDIIKQDMERYNNTVALYNDNVDLATRIKQGTVTENKETITETHEDGSTTTKEVIKNYKCVYTDADGKAQTITITPGKYNSLMTFADKTSHDDKQLADFYTDVTPVYGVDDTGKQKKNGDAVTNGVFFGSLNMLNAAGDYEEGGCTIRGYKYYMNALDTLAQTMADQINTQNLSPNYTKDGLALNTVTQADGVTPMTVTVGGVAMDLYSVTAADGTKKFGTISKADGDKNYTFTEVAATQAMIDAPQAAYMTENKLLAGEIENGKSPAMATYNGKAYVILAVTDNTTGNQAVCEGNAHHPMYALVDTDNDSIVTYGFVDGTKNADGTYTFNNMNADGTYNYTGHDDFAKKMPKNIAGQTGYSYSVCDVANTSDTEVVRASNIHVSDEWLQGTSHVVNTTEFSYDGDDNSAANDNLLKFVKLFEKDTNFTTKDGGQGITIYTGGYEDYLSAIGDIVSLDVYTETSTYESYTAVLSSIDNDRLSVSSVSIDEEAVDIYKFQRAYQASSRVITAMDEMLDKLINSTGTVGR